MRINILEITDKSDLTDVLELQKLAFTEVAKQIGTYDLLPLQQTIAQIQEEFEQGKVLKCINEKNHIIGSVRAYCDKNNCYVGKLVVHPDVQNQGIGKALMYEVERYFPLCHKFILFTGKNTPNTFYLYKKMGYQTIEEYSVGGVDLIAMEKRQRLCPTRQ